MRQAGKRSKMIFVAGSQRLLGFHCSAAGGLANAIRRGAKLGCTAIQLFTKNNNRWLGPPLTLKEIDAFRTAWAASPIRCIMSHVGYLVNLASTDPAITEHSMESMRMELQNAQALDIPYVVVHPGAHKGEGEAMAIRRVAERLNILLEETVGDQLVIAVEGTAGQGSSLGHRFEHLRDILAGVRYGDRVGVCLDTAHLFAAGYDLRSASAYRSTWEAFDRIVGRAALRTMHLNDTKRELGSRVDRHEHIGKGAIGLSGFRLLMRDLSLRAVPMVMETPKGKTDAVDRRNLTILQSLVK
ncbi:MAG: deoxyribonuclease IV [Deltaproteobacteria bacterium]|nr:deoxyribonuclease IV [Deltaproteobacteria bacterium]